MPETHPWRASQSSYYLGCPVWACPRWQGNLFTRHAPRADWLGQYAAAFNAVEGNSTFYGLPALDTIRRWADTVGPGFRFALKFPRAISHEKRLLDAGPETEPFIEVLDTLRRANCIGPSFLQLPRGFSGYHLTDLESYLKTLPSDYQYAVEVRHHDYFDNGPAERELVEMLRDLHIDRVIFDSRPLFSAPPTDDAETAAQGRKPQLPVHRAVTGNHPMIRFVGCNDVRRAVPWIREWIPYVDDWIKAGLTPFVFAHTPDEHFAPQLARLFHEELMRHNHAIEEMPVWPGEREPPLERQLELF